MSNTIELAKSFVPKLDECYRLASLTSVLDGAPELAKQGANANELIIPMMSMDGLADYSRNPDADAYVFGYRMVGIAKAYKNMLSGMYFSHDQA